MTKLIASRVGAVSGRHNRLLHDVFPPNDNSHLYRRSTCFIASLYICLYTAFDANLFIYKVACRSKICIPKWSPDKRPAPLDVGPRRPSETLTFHAPCDRVVHSSAVAFLTLQPCTLIPVAGAIDSRCSLLHGSNQPGLMYGIACPLPDPTTAFCLGLRYFPVAWPKNIPRSMLLPSKRIRRDFKKWYCYSRYIRYKNKTLILAYKNVRSRCLREPLHHVQIIASLMRTSTVHSRFWGWFLSCFRIFSECQRHPLVLSLFVFFSFMQCSEAGKI